MGGALLAWGPLWCKVWTVAPGPDGSIPRDGSILSPDGALIGGLSPWLVTGSQRHSGRWDGLIAPPE